MLSLEGAPKSQVDATVRGMRESVMAAQTDVAGVARYLQIALGENVAAKNPPPFKLIAFVESLGLGPLSPRVLSPGDLIAEIIDGLPEGLKNAGAVRLAHKATVGGALEQPWFEAGEPVERLLGPIRTEGASQGVADRLFAAAARILDARLRAHRLRAGARPQGLRPDGRQSRARRARNRRRRSFGDRPAHAPHRRGYGRGLSKPALKPRKPTSGAENRSLYGTKVARFPSDGKIREGRMTLHADPASLAHALDKGPEIVERKLDNGMTAIVIPDHRAPVVTHMVWYRNGSADDPPGKSGIAHFLEHLMFKGTEKHPKGAFSEAVAEIGGQENAFTGNDYTAYFQRVAKEHLGLMMSYEADRMTGLILTDEIVAPERDVVLEERRMHCDADPSAQLSEAMQSAVFTHHPYGIPVIGWGHEIEDLGREDALAYYGRFYTPENAILIVAGDVEPEEALKLAAEHYGSIKPRGEPPVRKRPKEPKPVAKRTVEVTDDKVEQPAWQALPARATPTAAPGQSEALEVLAHLLGGGATSYLYRKLVIESTRRSAPGLYAGSALDETRFFLYGMPAEGVPLPSSTPPSTPPWTASSPRASRAEELRARQDAAGRRRPSTRRTARPRSRAGTAPRSPPARPSPTCRRGPPASRR